VKIGDFDMQPSFDELDEATTEYEEKNDIPVYKKMSKMIKDQSRSIKAWADAPMNPDEGNNP